MGLIIQRRPRSTSVETSNDLQNYALSQIGINYDTIKVYDSPEVPLNYIRSIIRSTPQTDQIHFILDTR